MNRITIEILQASKYEQVIQNFQKNVFGGQSSLSNLLSITMLETDSTVNISCEFSDFSKMLGELI